MSAHDHGERRGAPHPIEALHVVVPAHDEEELLGRCLDSIAASARVLRRRRPDVNLAVTVVLDSCTDGSHLVARSRGVHLERVDARSVGVARALGFARTADRMGDRDPARVWLVSTDADTVVPRSWLTDHHTAATGGADLLIGRVRPDPAELHPHALAVWHERHHGADVHVHGANLGVRWSAYDAVGGFPPLAEHEDIDLVHRLWRAGFPWTVATTVTTSARERGRTPGGFARYIARLNDETRWPGRARPVC